MMKKLPLTSALIGLLLIFACPQISFSQSKWEKLNQTAQKHYSREDASQLSDVKIKQINYFFTQSFYFEKNPNSKSTTPCDVKLIDVEEYSKFRLQDKSRRVEMSGCSDFIVLLSYQEVEQAFKKIEATKE